MDGEEKFGYFWLSKGTKGEEGSFTNSVVGLSSCMCGAENWLLIEPVLFLKKVSKSSAVKEVVEGDRGENLMFWRDCCWSCCGSMKPWQYVLQQRKMKAKTDRCLDFSGHYPMSPFFKSLINHTELGVLKIWNSTKCSVRGRVRFRVIAHTTSARVSFDNFCWWEASLQSALSFRLLLNISKQILTWFIAELA